MTRVIWNAAGLVSVAIGIIGILVPLLPGAVFLALAAYCFARGSQRLHDWLVNHRLFGPGIRNWRDHGAIRRPAKRMAIIAIASSFIVTLGLGVPGWALGLQALALGGVSVFILTRPEGPRP